MPRYHWQDLFRSSFIHFSPLLTLLRKSTCLVSPPCSTYKYPASGLFEGKAIAAPISLLLPVCFSVRRSASLQCSSRLSEILDLDSLSLPLSDFVPCLLHRRLRHPSPLPHAIAVVFAAIFNLAPPSSLSWQQHKTLHTLGDNTPTSSLLSFLLVRAFSLDEIAASSPILLISYLSSGDFPELTRRRRLYSTLG